MAQFSHLASGKKPVPDQAVRVTIAYRGGELRVANRQTVAMRSLPSQELQAYGGESGFWFQLEDAGGRVLYRRVLHNPVAFDAETISDDPRHPLKRVALMESEGIFFLVVPLMREAHTVRVFSSPFDPDKSGEPAREVLSFGLFSGGETEPEPGPGGPEGGPQRPRRRPRKTGGEQPDRDQSGEEA